VTAFSEYKKGNLMKQYLSPTDDLFRLQTLIDAITLIGVATYRDVLGYDTVTVDDIESVVPRRKGVSDFSANTVKKYASIQYREEDGRPFVPHIETMRASTRKYGGYSDEYVDLINDVVDLTDIEEE